MQRSLLPVLPTALGFVGLLGLLAPPASAAPAAPTATFTVNSTADAADALPGDGICETFAGNGVCTLRAAVMEANSTPGALVVLPAQVVPYLLTIPPTGGDGPTVGDINVAADMTIQGAGAATTIVDGNLLDRIFDVAALTTVTISDVTILHGKLAGPNGAGIRNSGTLTVSRCRITVNDAGTGDGGGIYNHGTLTVTDSVLSGNKAVYGGGLYVAGTSATMSGSTVNGNTATDGAGIYVNGAPITIVNSTISDNAATANGGGLYASNGSGFTLLNVTVTLNKADAALTGAGTGGGAYLQSTGSRVFTNTILADNVGSALVSSSHVVHPSDCAGTIVSGGFNLVHQLAAYSTQCTIVGVAPADADPMLAALQNNGGAAASHALLAGSPAVGAGDPTGCKDAVAAVLHRDQRGAYRPTSGCDIGAYERGSNGDANANGTVDVLDVFYLINFLFAGGPAPAALSDVNGDGALTVQDVFVLINHLFAGGAPPL